MANSCSVCRIFGCEPSRHPRYEQTKQSPRNSTFNTILDEMRAMHDKKNHDYAEDNNTYSNFEQAASFAGTETEKSFGILVGTKMARITQLLKKKEAKNESLEDSLLDLAVYTVLWLAWRRDNAEG